MHNINIVNGKAAFVSHKQKAWHELGQIHDRPMLASEALELGGLNYIVEKMPLRTTWNDPNGGKKIIEIPNTVATMRMDTGSILGVVGSNYQIVQNRDAFSFFDAIVGEGAAIYETAGALGNGEIFFITAKLPKIIKVGKDVTEQYLFITSSHDGTHATAAAFTPTRIVCANTLNVALSNAGHMVKIRHTRNALENLKQAHKLMGIVTKDASDLEQLLNRMAHVRMNDAQLRKFVELTIAPKMETAEKEPSTKLVNMVDAVLEYNFSDDTQKNPECVGTLYGAVNAITGYYHNAVKYDSAESKLDNTIYGNGAKKGATALDLATRALRDISFLS